MGLFDLFKKKPDKVSDDFNPFDLNSTKNYIRKRVKAENPFATEREINRITNEVLSPKRENLDHLTSDGDLPFGWLYANKDFIECIESEYRHFSDAYYNAKCVKEKHSALKFLVQYREDIKKLCQSKGECFEFWATAILIGPGAEDDLKKLQYMEEHLDELLKQEAETEYIKKTLPAIIKKEPGVIQADLYKRFHPDCKGIISSELYYMEKRGQIIREKSGRSYALYMK